MKPVIIIGGGLGGLSLGYYLTKKGIPVTIIERETVLGGTCRPVCLGDKIVDSYYHVLSGGANSLMDLISEIGLESKLYPVNITQAFYQNGVIYPVCGIFDLISFNVLTLWERMNLAKTFVYSKFIQDWRKLDQITAKDWLSGIGGKKLYEQFWKPIMTCKFGDVVETVSAADMWFRIKRLGEVTLPGKVKACYIRGTLKTVLEKLEELIIKQGGKICKGVTVREILEKDGSVVSLILSNELVIDVDNVISTIPLPELEFIIPSQYSEYKKELHKISYLHNITLIVKTSKPITSFYQLNLGDSEIPFSGMIGADSFYPPEMYGGYISYITRYLFNDKSILEKDETELLQDYIPHIQKICPEFLESWIIDKHAVKSRYVEPLHSVSYSTRIPDSNSPISGLTLMTTAQIYPEPTILDTVVNQAKILSDKY